jgi:cyclase
VRSSSERGRTLTGEPARFRRGLTEVADGVWAWLQPNGGWGEANAGLVLGRDCALLVDTLWDERLAAEMLAEIQGVLSGRPLAFIFNTHSDGDHWWGNRAAGGGPQILTTQASLNTMHEDATPHELARLARLTRLARRVPGPLRPLSRYVGAMLEPYDFRAVELRFPDRTFSGEHALELGDRTVRLIEVGPAHTPGDAVVQIPDARVVLAADVLWSGVTPVMWFGPLEGWLAALDRLLSLDAEVYVPGHGPPGDRATVRELRDYLAWVGEAVRRHHGQGRSSLEIARGMLAAPEYERWRGWLGPERLLITVSTIRAALDGVPPVGVSSRGRARLFAQVGALAEELGA